MVDAHAKFDEVQKSADLHGYHRAAELRGRDFLLKRAQNKGLFSYDLHLEQNQILIEVDDIQWLRTTKYMTRGHDCGDVACRLVAEIMAGHTSSSNRTRSAPLLLPEEEIGSVG